MNRRLRTILLAASLLLVIGMPAWLTHVLFMQTEETARSERRVKIESLAHEAKMSIDRQLAAFITPEQSRGYYEYAPAYAHKRPYDERMDAPKEGEAHRISRLVSYLPDSVTAYIQISPEGHVTGPSLSTEQAAAFNAETDLGRDLNAKVKAMVEQPAAGPPTEALRHEPPTPPQPKTEPAAHRRTFVDSVSAFVPVEHGGRLFILRQVRTSRGDFLQGALMNMDYLNTLLPAHIKQALPDCRLSAYDPLNTPRAQAPPVGTLYFDYEPLVFIPGATANIVTADYGKMLFWTLALIWSMVILGVAGVIWLMLGNFRLEQRRGDFVSAVTHELRTPLTSFSLYTEMLEDGLVPEHKKQEYYANMQRECRRLEHLIDNVLAYSRLQRNAIRRAKDTLTVQELFEPIAEKIERRLTEADFNFTFVLAQPIRILPIKTDSVAVEQIMDNLTTNAIKYAKVDKARVQLTVQADMYNIVVRFRDNGPGISRKNAGLVFLPFSRTRDATESRKPGVGLGLSLARDTARSLGGDLKLEFGTLAGASFILTLPKA